MQVKGLGKETKDNSLSGRKRVPSFRHPGAVVAVPEK